MLTSYATMSWSGNLNCSKDAAPRTQVESLKINTYSNHGSFPQILNYDLKTDLRQVFKHGVSDTNTYRDPHTHQTY